MTKIRSFLGRAAGAAVVLVLVLVASQFSAIPGPLNYATTWVGPNGMSRDVQFQGTASRGSVSGFLEVNDAVMRVEGTIGTDGSVSGSVLGTGSPAATVATFSGRPDEGGVLRGTVNYGGALVHWSAPGIILPDPSAP